MPRISNEVSLKGLVRLRKEELKGKIIARALEQGKGWDNMSWVERGYHKMKE